MIYKGVALSLISLLSLSLHAQEGIEASKKELDPQVYLDSIKASFVNHSTSERIEKLWLGELINQDLYEEMNADLTGDEFFSEDAGEYDGLTTEVLKERLALLNEKTPFNVEYNESLERLIKSFLKKRKKSFERLLGLSEYYFPLFEEQLAKNNIPLEVKYLTIVESALNPKAVSHMGATGLWQFMYATGKQYNLEVSSFKDDRVDPLKASEAAAKFLGDLYTIFGDWDLVLASYNAGPGNVSKAIRRSNGLTNYWNIRPNLPRETQNYLPAFYATMYIFEYAKEHGIKANDNIPMKLVQTDTVAVKRMMSFEQISKLLDISEEELEFLNPTYKLKVIPYSSSELNFLRLPLDRAGLLVSNEEKVYAYVDFEENRKEKPNYDIAIAQTSSVRNKYHTIRKGESVGVIAKKYGLSVVQLKKLNNMKTNVIYPGKKLIVGKSTVAQASTNGYYVVKKGDSLYSISKNLPGVTISKLKALNNMSDQSTLQPGMKLRIN
ncbi:transglycosylase SLT domain-containing protein [Myroides sp. NP-2]|uniref:lytic transglycosylase domain-containing protein n=1 Tax=Myroides sp. NP-2 TaxID=2759945 RepID=UPI0015FD21ED|nr:lytic transglycosylase domain-containing protein [Myroides sp. NP-2]MBB1149231.1 transglycosylase SLT domain-containing protein [Myroides sp. NP-2]